MNPSDKVVCIDDGPCKTCGNPQKYITNGQVYCIEQYRTSFSGKPIVDLVGIDPSSCHIHWGRLGWCTSRFRLLYEVQAEAQAEHKQAYEPTLIP